LLKALKKLGIEGTFLNLIKAIYDRPRANIILNVEQVKLPVKVRNETGLFTFSTPILQSFGIPSQSNKTRPNGIQIQKEAVKVILFADDMTLYPRHPKNSTKKLLEIVNSFGKVTGYKMNIQKSLAFLYTNNTQTEKGIRETIPFTIASKTIKQLGINSMKETKDLFNENYK
jgi:isocitrate dehydrogenase